ncbi:hypothetical protein ADICYQ_1932 [Cyclobacterium qasimii M12-11B]|uniref:Uncharacterized protein n=1 Tax=Cyclobacterium qasimii M12-11B TaxID=641524 RepID=S7VFP0_9BACT|nr:hypothetical protein ADICYQ_1932 [Cyclobacterium qasimii M12-11B]
MRNKPAALISTFGFCQYISQMQKAYYFCPIKDESTIR